MGRCRARFEPRDVLEIVSNNNASFLVVLIGLGIDHEQNDLVVVDQAVRWILESVANTPDYLLMILVGNVDIVDLDDAVAFAEASRLGGRVGVHFADVLAHLGTLGMQIESIALKVGPLLQMAETRSGRVLVQLALSLVTNRVVRVVQLVRGIIDAIFTIVAFNGHLLSKSKTRPSD